MQNILDRLTTQLHRRAQEAGTRILPRQLPTIDFASNDYLGLARSATLAERLQQATDLYEGSLYGATGSRLITGNSELVEALEQELADYFRAPACLLYNSGYAANQGLLSAILQRGDTVIYDELAHACIKDGCRLSPAVRYSFRHNDLEHLRQKLSKVKGPVFVVVESLYSMDGDQAPLQEIVRLCRDYEAALIVDEAHSTGIWGPDGAGSCVAQGVADEVFARVYTFGKAIGAHGACVAGSKVLVNYLVNYSRPFIYTTALPGHAVLAIQEAVRYRKEHPELVEDLFRNIGLFHQLLLQKGKGLYERLLPAKGPIQALLIPGNQPVIDAAFKLHALGFSIWPILAPTVPLGEERLRICLHAHNTTNEITGFVNALEEVLLEKHHHEL